MSHKSNTIGEVMWDFQYPLCGAITFYVYAYLLRASRRLRKLIQKFMATNPPLPSRYRRFCLTTSVASISLGILEMELFDLQIFRSAPEGYFNFEYFYNIYFSHWIVFTPYYSILAWFHYFIEKLGILGWFYGDVIVITLAKALSERYNLLSNSIPNIRSEAKEMSKAGMRADKFREEFMILLDITEEIQEFTVPLILGCYVNNIYLIVVTLFNWITPCSDFTTEIWFWAYEFFHFLFRFISVTYFVAEVHHAARSLLETLHQCPMSVYSVALERMEQLLSNNPPGICLFGVCTITRNLFLSIVGFLFTV
ncbi:unnamed protein product [Orchesella dallaii]|uniref:Gustatory receptor n=1 Tax=Orchesella dallaii TaxID=48710 RepID=A0ABP1S6X8_9HEXA